jgi:hypothetical protein
MVARDALADSEFFRTISGTTVRSTPTMPPTKGVNHNQQSRLLPNIAGPKGDSTLERGVRTSGILPNQRTKTAMADLSLC